MQVHISSIFSIISEAFASESLEIVEEILLMDQIRKHSCTL